MEIAAKLGYLEMIESGTTTCVDHLSVNYADRTFEAAGETGIRGVLGKEWTSGHRRAPQGRRRGTRRERAADPAVPRGVRRSNPVRGHATVRRLP